MSSLLNVSNASNESEVFSLTEIEMLVDSGDQNWFKRAHIGQYLGIAHIITLTAKLSEEDITSPAFHQAEGEIHSMDPPREDAQDHDIFISLMGALYVTINSRKDKGKALNKHILKYIVQRGLDARIEEIPGKYQQAITDCDNQIKALEFINEKYQQKILRLNKEIDDLIANRRVARRGSFDDVLCFIKKNSKDVHPYYVI